MNRPDYIAPEICILMSTYNGGRFLAEQLQSIESQSYPHWRLVMSDDGSSDDTLAIAKAFQQKWGEGRVEIRMGPQQGLCQNFLAMACDANIRADFYAFSDQDDVWLPNKLEQAVAYFNAANKDQSLPNVYCGRTRTVDEQLKPLGFSPLFSLPRSFRNALVQSIAGGNTMVFNHAAKVLLEQAGLQAPVIHDWWLYQLVKGAGGFVYYDPEPTVLYRQHPDAVIGANTSVRGKIERLRNVIDGRFKEWNAINYAALCNVQHLLTKDNQEILHTFGVLRTAHLKDRVRLLEVCGLYRQTKQGTLSLWLATILNKI